MLCKAETMMNAINVINSLVHGCRSPTVTETHTQSKTWTQSVILDTTHTFAIMEATTWVGCPNENISLP